MNPESGTGHRLLFSWKTPLDLLANTLNVTAGVLETTGRASQWLYIAEPQPISNQKESVHPTAETLRQAIKIHGIPAPKKVRFPYPDQQSGPFMVLGLPVFNDPDQHLVIWLLYPHMAAPMEKDEKLLDGLVQNLRKNLEQQIITGRPVFDGYHPFLEKNEAYQMIFENSPVGIFFYDTNLVITLANKKFCTLLGSPREKLIGFNINQIKETRVLPALIESVNGREGFYKGLYHATLTDRIISILLKTAPVYNNEKVVTGGIGIFQDLTEFDAERKAREESDARFMMVAMHTNDVIFEWNDQQQGLQWQGNVKSIIGKNPTPRSLQDMMGMIHPDDRSRIEKTLFPQYPKTVFWKEEFRMVPSPGQIKYIMGSGINALNDEGHISVLGTLTDVTHERELVKSLEEALETARSNHAKAQGLISVIPDLYFVFDRDGYFRDFHAESTHQLYIPPEKFLDKPVDQVLPPDIARLTREKIKATLSRKGMETYTYQLEGKIFESRMVPYLENKVITIVRDVTRAKATEKELVEAKERAEESDRLKSSFLANMSHEIRTPLNGIMGFTELLMHEDVLPENRNFYLNLILQSGQQLLGVINDVLEISKIETGQVTLYKTDVNLKDFIHSMQALFEIRAREKKIHLATAIPKSFKSHTCHTDLQKLTQIFTNLLANAVKFTRVNGTIQFGYQMKEGHFCFFVKDTGIGIDPKHHATIFERFRQVEDDPSSEKSGSGLGLSISKSLIEYMGGRIWVESEPGRGSTFFFTLPR